MSRLMYSAGALIVAAIMLGGCVQTDRHDRYPVERGGYENRDRDHNRDGDYNRDGDHRRDGDDNRDRDGNRDRDNGGYQDRDNNDRDGYRDRDNSDRDGYRDRDNSGDADHRSGRDDGERAIVSYVQQHKLPVKITGIEQLPAATGKPASTVTRYRVSVESTGLLKTKADRIVSYNPATGELSLER